MFLIMRSALSSIRIDIKLQSTDKSLEILNFQIFFLTFPLSQKLTQIIFLYRPILLFDSLKSTKKYKSSSWTLIVIVLTSYSFVKSLIIALF